jgi:tetraacyldisaccharide 4'-kinase
VGAADDVRARLVALWAQSEPTWLARTLQPLSWLYRAAAALHRGLYASGLRARRSAPRPVIVVGNLVAGGAGKTPTVIALAALLRQLGHRPGVISRGYGRRDERVRIVQAHDTADEVGDEPLLIHLRAQVPVAVAVRRVDAAHALCERHADVDLLIADDGLQHHALARRAQVIVFDSRGAGNGLLLPAGPLREPLPGDVPPRSLVLYSDGVKSTALPGWTATRRLAGAVELGAWWRGEQAERQALHALRGRRVWACAGIAQPERFFKMLREQGLQFDALPRPDHASYRELPWPPRATEVVVTEKDAVKLAPESIGRTRVWVAPLDFELDPKFGAALAALLDAPSAGPRPDRPPRRSS